MIVVDTNVISAMMQNSPPVSVISWFNRQPNDVFYLPSIVVAEIRFGLQRMPDGQRKIQLMTKFDYLTHHIFVSRILPFAQNEAEAYAILRAARESQGKPMSLADAQIAAIAQVNHAVLATRNTKDFQGCGIVLVNPFE